MKKDYALNDVLRYVGFGFGQYRNWNEMALGLFWIAILLRFKWIRTDLTILSLKNVLKKKIF